MTWRQWFRKDVIVSLSADRATGDVRECSVIVIDLKADSLELLATQMAAAERLRAERGISIPVKCFSNQADRSTFAFNPMTQPFWDNFDLLTQTDILCGANGLTYGTDYGAGYFSSANAAVLYHAIKSFPHVRTFQELADCIGTVITTAKKQDLHPEICKAGVHVQEVIKRLANCTALNVTDATGHDPQVVEQAIDLTKPFWNHNCCTSICQPRFHRAVLLRSVVWSITCCLRLPRKPNVNILCF